MLYLLIIAAGLFARDSGPPLASMLFPPVLVPAFIGELSFAAWLTVKGVNVAKWKEMAARSRK